MDDVIFAYQPKDECGVWRLMLKRHDDPTTGYHIATQTTLKEAWEECSKRAMLFRLPVGREICKSKVDVFIYPSRLEVSEFIGDCAEKIDLMWVVDAS